MNEIEQKQIEEMQKVLDDEQIRIANTTEGFKTLMQKGVTYCHAKAFYHAGYRNVKDKVVLDKEEYQKDFSNQFNKGYSHGRKETVREILQIIKREYDYIGNLERIIAEKYGVEVE